MSSDIDPLLLAIIVANIISLFSMLTLVLSDPGNLQANDFKSDTSVLKKLASEFDNYSGDPRDAKELTSLEDICFICLSLTTPH